MSRPRRAAAAKWESIKRGANEIEPAPPRAFGAGSGVERLVVPGRAREIAGALIAGRGGDAEAEGDDAARELSTAHAQRDLAVLRGRAALVICLGKLEAAGREGHARRMRGLARGEG